MPHAWMFCERAGEQRLGAPAIAAPRAAELEQRRAFERVDLGASRLLVGIRRVHLSAATFRFASPVSMSFPTIPSMSKKTCTILKTKGVGPCSDQVTTVALSFGCRTKSTLLCASKGLLKSRSSAIREGGTASTIVIFPSPTSLLPCQA